MFWLAVSAIITGFILICGIVHLMNEELNELIKQTDKDLEDYEKMDG